MSGGARVLLAAFTAAAVLLAAHAEEVAATSSLVRWSGRTVRDEAAGGPGRVAFDWQSVQAVFSVTNATTVWATLNSTFWAAAPHALQLHEASPPPPVEGAARSLQQSQFPKFGVYRVYVNGVRSNADNLGGVVVMPGESELVLVSNLHPQQSYNLSLWYTTDPVFNAWPDLDAGIGCRQSVVRLRTDGAFAPPPPPRARSMLVLGDSITSGNAMFLPCDNATKCDSSQSYAGRLCEAFGLNCTQATASSKGLTRNCCDALAATVPVLANRTLAQDNATRWDWAAAPYDAVLIHLGTNDGDVGAAAFVPAYAALLRHVSAHGASPTIPIFCAFGPNTDVFAPWMRAAMATSGVNATELDFMAAPMDGCGHPGVAGHAAMAHIAAPVVARVTGWPYEPGLLGRG